MEPVQQLKEKYKLTPAESQQFITSHYLYKYTNGKNQISYTLDGDMNEKKHVNKTQYHLDKQSAERILEQIVSEEITFESTETEDAVTVYILSFKMNPNLEMTEEDPYIEQIQEIKRDEQLEFAKEYKDVRDARSKKAQSLEEQIEMEEYYEQLNKEKNYITEKKIIVRDWLDSYIATLNKTRIPYMTLIQFEELFRQVSKTVRSHRGMDVDVESVNWLHYPTERDAWNANLNTPPFVPAPGADITVDPDYHPGFRTGVGYYADCYWFVKELIGRPVVIEWMADWEALHPELIVQLPMPLGEQMVDRTNAVFVHLRDTMCRRQINDPFKIKLPQHVLTWLNGEEMLCDPEHRVEACSYAMDKEKYCTYAIDCIDEIDKKTVLEIETYYDWINDVDPAEYPNIKNPIRSPARVRIVDPSIEYENYAIGYIDGIATHPAPVRFPDWFNIWMTDRANEYLLAPGMPGPNEAININTPQYAQAVEICINTADAWNAANIAIPPPLQIPEWAGNLRERLNALLMPAFRNPPVPEFAVDPVEYIEGIYDTMEFINERTRPLYNGGQPYINGANCLKPDWYRNSIIYKEIWGTNLIDPELLYNPHGVGSVDYLKCVIKVDETVGGLRSGIGIAAVPLFPIPYWAQEFELLMRPEFRNPAVLPALAVPYFQASDLTEEVLNPRTRLAMEQPYVGLVPRGFIDIPAWFDEYVANEAYENLVDPELRRPVTNINTENYGKEAYVASDKVAAIVRVVPGFPKPKWLENFYIANPILENPTHRNPRQAVDEAAKDAAAAYIVLNPQHTLPPWAV